MDVDLTNATLDPICATCGANIGAMPLDVYLQAIERRGPYLLCPGCRESWCDCCGWFFPGVEHKTFHSHSGQYLGRACVTCSDFILTAGLTREDFPHFRIMLKPNVKSMNSRIRAQEWENMEGER
jgi:DNA-directed RNA polymerase subunit RPC12/RpoP